MSERNKNSHYRFGIFEFDTVTGELRKEGRSYRRLQGQHVAMLGMLLEQHGALVSREDLRKRLWPADTFVDYDHSVNSIINKLREALGDSAENPRFVQTLPRRGYRFIAPVETVETTLEAAQMPDSASVLDPNDAQTESLPPPNAGLIARAKRAPLLSDPAELPAAPRKLVRFLFLMLQVLYLTFYAIFLVNFEHAAALLGRAFTHPMWIFIPMLITALVGIPTRLYLANAVLFGYAGISRQFQKLFPLMFPVDELWALAPLIIVEHIGIGLAVGFTAALLYLPFSQRSLLLMADGAAERRGGS